MFKDSELYRNTLKDAMPEHSEELIGKTVLVTGSTGLIGTYLVDALMNWGGCQKVIAAARSREAALARFDEHMSKKCFSIAQYDLFKPFHIMDRCDYIIHLAANASPSKYRENPAETLTGIVGGVARLLDYCVKRKDTRFVFVSSNEVYGSIDKSPVTESDSGYVPLLDSRSCYPMGKRAAETLCACYEKEYGVNCVVARACHTYGPTMTISDNRAASQFLSDAVKGRDIVLQSDGSAERSYIFVADCVNGILTSMLKGAKGEAYNVASDAHSVLSLATAIAVKAGVTVKAAESAAPGDKGYSPVSKNIVSAQKLEGLGWKPKYDLESGIATTVGILKGE